MKKSAQLARRALKIHETLLAMFPDAKCSLDFRTPFELLVSTVLSAQCTDERVNLVTPAFFQTWPDAESLAQATLEQIEDVVKSTGFYRNKAKSLLGMARVVVTEFHGEIPAEMEALVKLPGVGRKTANVVLGNCFGVPGITVDTHVGRLSQRLGLTCNKDPEKIEQDLMVLIPAADWTKFSHCMILHGRTTCLARKPKCSTCTLRSLCDFHE